MDATNELAALKEHLRKKRPLLLKRMESILTHDSITLGEIVDAFSKVVL